MFLCKCFWPCSTFVFLEKKKHNFVLERFQLLKTQWWVPPSLGFMVSCSQQFPAIKPRKHYDLFFLLCTNFTSLENFCQLLLLNFVLFFISMVHTPSIVSGHFLKYLFFVAWESLAFFLCLCCPMNGTHMLLLPFHLS